MIFSTSFSKVNLTLRLSLEILKEIVGTYVRTSQASFIKQKYKERNHEKVKS